MSITNYSELQKLHRSRVSATFINRTKKPELPSLAALFISILDMHDLKKYWISSKDLLYKLLESYT